MVVHQNGIAKGISACTGVWLRSRVVTGEARLGCEGAGASEIRLHSQWFGAVPVAVAITVGVAVAREGVAIDAAANEPERHNDCGNHQWPGNQ